MRLRRFAVSIILLSVFTPFVFAQDQNAPREPSTTENTTPSTGSATPAAADSTAMTAPSGQPTTTPGSNRLQTIYPSPTRMGNLTIKPSPITCIYNPWCTRMAAITQNVGRSLPNPCKSCWYNRIALTGGINVDLGKWGKNNANYMGENYQRASLNDAYLNISAIVNNWTTVFGSLSFNNATINDVLSSTPKSHVAEFNTAYSHNILVGSNYTFQLEQSYITFMNLEQQPIYVQIGKQFQDFGRYAIHPITEPMSQVMSKTLYPSFKLGFLWGGFSGSAYAFEEPLAKVNHTSRSLDYGFSLGYNGQYKELHVDLGVGYLYNIVAVNDISYQVNQFNLNNPLFLPGGGFNQHISGIALYLDLVYHCFSLSGRFTSALQTFNVYDLPMRGLADITPSGIPYASASGAQPSAGGVQLGYGFQFYGAPQNIYIGYQASSEASGLLLPQKRWVAGYVIETGPNTSIGGEWDLDKGYRPTSGGNGIHTSMVTLRGSIKFN